MQNKPEKFSIQDAMRLANSPAGKELISALQSAGGSDIKQAQQAVAKGDYEGAKQSLSQILKSPQVQALLKEMEQQT